MTTIGWSSRAELVHKVVTLSRAGTSRRAIARSLDISRNTVRAILAAHRRDRDAEHSAISSPPTRAPRPKKVDGFEGRIAELFERYPDITAQRVFEILSEEGFTGGYTAIKRYVRKTRPRPKPTPSRTAPVYGPGEMAESDWSPFVIKLTTGKTLDIDMFGYVLTYSPRKYFAAYPTSDLHALMDGHLAAFKRFNGAAHACIYDSQKPVVLRWEGQQPIYNPRFLAFAAHYEFRPRAVRGQPNAKPRVERTFWEAVRSFFNAREFRDLDDLREQLAHWLDRIVDQRPRRIEGRTCLERFEDEKDKLLPLPRHPYDVARVSYRLCSIDGFVDWMGNRYAVPYDHVTDLLPVRITQRELFVYAADLTCIARHELAPRGAGKKLDPANYHPPPRRQSPIDIDQLVVAFEGMGPGAMRFFRLLSAGAPRVWAHQARCILQLRGRFETRDLDAALAHAARFGALDFAAVERIVEARSPPRTLDEYVAEETARRLERTLGIARTEPRDLTEYDRLPFVHRSPSSPPSEEGSCPSAPTPETPVQLQPPAVTSPSSDSASTSDSSG